MLPASSHPSIRDISKFFRLILVAPATTVISEPFTWLVLNKFRKTCLALKYIRVVGCRASFS